MIFFNACSNFQCLIKLAEKLNKRVRKAHVRVLWQLSKYRTVFNIFY